MNICNYLAAAVLSFGVASVAKAETREHFESEPAESLEQAVGHFNKGNARLTKMLSKDDISAEDLAAIHELTDTLENALVKINDELSGLAVTLEEVHQASESADTDKLKYQGDKYLSVTQALNDIT